MTLVALPHAAATFPLVISNKKIWHERLSSIEGCLSSKVKIHPWRICIRRKLIIWKTVIMIKFKRISFNQSKHNNFDTFYPSNNLYSPFLGPFSISSLSNYNRTELQVSIFIIFPWPSVIFLLNSIIAYSENVLILKSETLSYDI